MSSRSYPFVSIRQQSCTRRLCAGGRVVVHSRKYPRLRCTNCGHTWVAHRHEPYFGLRKDPLTVRSAAVLLQQQESVRRVAHLLHVSPSTVQRWKSRFSPPSSIF